MSHPDEIDKLAEIINKINSCENIFERKELCVHLCDQMERSGISCSAYNNYDDVSKTLSYTCIDFPDEIQLIKRTYAMSIDDLRKLAQGRINPLKHVVEACDVMVMESRTHREDPGIKIFSENLIDKDYRVGLESENIISVLKQIYYGNPGKMAEQNKALTEDLYKEEEEYREI